MRVGAFYPNVNIESKITRMETKIDGICKYCKAGYKRNFEPTIGNTTSL